MGTPAITTPCYSSGNPSAKRWIRKPLWYKQCMDMGARWKKTGLWSWVRLRPSTDGVSTIKDNSWSVWSWSWALLLGFALSIEWDLTMSVTKMLWRVLRFMIIFLHIRVPSTPEMCRSPCSGSWAMIFKNICEKRLEKMFGVSQLKVPHGEFLKLLWLYLLWDAEHC